MEFDRKYVIERLRELAELSALSGENQFKTKAYTRAATQLEQFPGVALEESMKIDGIGASIFEKIRDFATTGTCDKTEMLKRKFAHLLGLLKIPKVGPVTALKLYNEYKVTTAEEIQKLIDKGEKIGKVVREGVAVYLGKSSDGRIPRTEAEKIAKPILAKLKTNLFVGRVEICGSYRRLKETVGDLDILVESKEPLNVLDTCKACLEKVEMAGTTKISGLVGNLQVDFRVIKPQEFPFGLLYFTGSKDFNEHQRGIVKKQNKKLNEYELKDLGTGESISCETERDVCKALGMDYVEPWNRG